jgi:hypothetical protein
VHSKIPSFFTLLDFNHAQRLYIIIGCLSLILKYYRLNSYMIIGSEPSSQLIKTYAVIVIVTPYHVISFKLKNYIIYRNYLNYKDEQDIQVSK